MRYAGVLQESTGQPRPNVAGVTFSLYEEQAGGAALWIETQNVQVDGQGHYSALLGATRTEGVPVELFRSGQARWLGIQVAGQPEEVRVPLASVPYAVQAGDAQMLGGRSAADYALSEQIREVQDELRAAGFDIAEDGTVPGGFVKLDKPSDSGPPQPPGSNSNPRAITNEDLNVKLDAILAKLNEPEPYFAANLCTEPAGNFEGLVGTETEVILKAEGKAGADVYGNGFFGAILASPKGKTGRSLKFSWDFLKLGLCWDLAAIVRNQRASASLRPLLLAGAAADGGNTAQLNLLDQIGNIDQTALLNKMLTLANGLQVDPTKLQNGLDRIQNLSFDGGPLAILQANADQTALLEALPIPPAVKTVLLNPGSLLEKFKEIKNTGLCNISPRPPALDALIGEFCDLATNERFAKLLDRVDGITGNINSTVTSVRNKVDNIIDRLPVAGDCKLFC
ncbi:MAG: hypothetical protein A3H28_10160 [Acidobacteria bacterium RIFCSPLOWO2_02_FULL_61_28]|nr:MAG: hypothetical protein A3H28_10160 [Acidobacteria bacterium RIFCSPLOWO2_02_FULL_61_28]